MKRGRLTIAVLGLVLAGVVTVPAAEARMDPDTYKITEVIDGDTLVVATEAGKMLRVRMIGIDAPEMRDTTKARTDAAHGKEDLDELLSMGQRARKYLTDDLQVTSFPDVFLEYDRHELDSQGNTLAYVHICPISVAYPPEEYMNCPKCITQHGDEYCYMLNGLIINNGFARPRPVPPNSRYTRFFLRLHNLAKQEQRGLWEKQGVDGPQAVKVVTFDPTPGITPRQGLVSEKQALRIALSYAGEKGIVLPDRWPHIGAIHHGTDGVWQVGINFNPDVAGARAEVWIDDRSGDVVRYLSTEQLR